MYLFIFKAISLVILNMAVFYQFAMAEEMECKKCHQDVYDEISAFTYKHYNNLLDECKKCHFDSENNKNKVDNKWTKISFGNYENEHIAIIKNITIDSTYQVKINLINKKNRKKESEVLSFIPTSISEFIVDDEIPPIISRIRVNQIDSSSVEIKFETDKFSDSIVEYGKTKDYGESLHFNTYDKRHIIRLSKLDSKKVYHFIITVTDPFGNRTISEDYTFDTGKAFNRDQESGKRKEDDTELDFKSIRIFRFKLKEERLKEESLKTAVKKAAISDIVAVYFIGTTEVASVVEYMKKENESASEEEKHGNNGLKSQREAEISTCLEKCHKEDSRSHIVGISIRRNMDVPNEIPLAEGKIITCITCHMPHGSKLRYLARVDFDKLCVLCHTNR